MIYIITLISVLVNAYLSYKVMMAKDVIANLKAKVTALLDYCDQLSK
jgi:hypothetical protein